MATVREEQLMGEVTSPGGFVFGVQGWSWGEQQPKSITFFLDGTASVYDKWGRPIKGTHATDGGVVLFAMGPPQDDDKLGDRDKYARHAKVIEALARENVDWTKLVSAGFPQIPYDELKKMPKLPPTSVEDLAKIKDKALRKDAVRARREADEELAKQMEADESGD